MGEMRASFVHGNGLFATRAVAKTQPIMSEGPLVIGSPGLQYTACWQMTDRLLGMEEHLPDNCLLNHSGLQWDTKDNKILNEMATRHGKNRNECYRLYAKVASVNVRVRGEGNLHAVYELAGFLNHSCDPNCIVENKGTEMTLVALKDISEGDELFINFIEIVADVELDTEKQKQVQEFRKQQIKQLYRFNCKCLVCSPNQNI